jgi:hypothetical protein
MQSTGKYIVARERVETRGDRQHTHELLGVSPEVRRRRLIFKILQFVIESIDYAPKDTESQLHLVGVN